MQFVEDDFKVQTNEGFSDADVNAIKKAVRICFVIRLMVIASVKMVTPDHFVQIVCLIIIIQFKVNAEFQRNVYRKEGYFTQKI